MNTIIKLGLAALAAGASSTLPSKAETPDTFTRHGLPTPGAYFKKKASPQPTAIVVRKSQKRVAEQNQAMANAGTKHTQRVASMRNH
jgi:hypothetical protein